MTITQPWLQPTAPAPVGLSKRNPAQTGCSDPGSASQHLPFEAGGAWLIKGLGKDGMRFSCLAQKIPETVPVLPREGQEFTLTQDAETLGRAFRSTGKRRKGRGTQLREVWMFNQRRCSS